MHLDAEEDDDHDAAGRIPTLMRPAAEVEAEVRALLLGTSRSILGVNHVNLHYLKGRVSVEATVSFDPEVRVREARDIARVAQRTIENVSDVVACDLHLELFDSIALAAPAAVGGHAAPRAPGSAASAAPGKPPTAAHEGEREGRKVTSDKALR